MFERVFAGALISGALLVPAVPMASAAPAAKAEHCVQHVTGQRASGELVVSPARCYPTFEEAMREEGVAAWGDGASARAARLQGSGSGVALLSFTLGTHYDLTGFNAAGGSTSTVGTGCTGGWLNTSAAWTNRISSTANGCPTITHYDGNNLTGDAVSTGGAGGNLGTMNNRTNSIRYS
jgi:hypothetical protein